MAPNNVISVNAVLFDYDDTLIDAREARDNARRAVIDFLSLVSGLDKSHVLDVFMNIERQMEAIGQFNRRVWFREVASVLGGIRLSDHEVNELVKMYWDSWRSGSRLFSDVLPTLAKLRRCGLRLGIITNTDGEPGLKRDRIRKDGVYELFDLVIIAGDDTKHVKPHPEPFMKALQVLDMRGNEVIYIGDNVGIDVPGAKAAGMRVGIINRYNTVDPGITNYKDVRPDFIIQSLTELLQLIGC
ncbi:HAD-IA family hydrolase [Vulcanisaeta distributa]|uniref:HAD family hydrolase n=1 Tax=Vulcanisaeta distributa TaxID=164451 RepID=UPI0006D188DD|nr:HAD-IA family hydrolase [Vulcanisaeta distributa]